MVLELILNPNIKTICPALEGMLSMSNQSHPVGYNENGDLHE